MCESAETLECILCAKRFGAADVRALAFFASTGICFDCYQKGQDAAYVAWCFGKSSLYSDSGQILEYGYDEDARICRAECPDRKICPLFMTGQVQRWRQEMAKGDDDSSDEKLPKGKLGKGVALPFRQTGAMTTRAFMICMKGVMVEDLVKWVKLQGGNSVRIMRIMRSGTHNGKRWKVNEANGYIRVIYDGQDA